MKNSGNRLRKDKKEGQATHIAPLRPSTLATFQSWGNSTGAGRVRLARTAKVVNH